MAAPNAPTLLSVAQATAVVAGQNASVIVVGAMQALITGTAAVAGLNLYRSPTGTGGWTLVDSAPLSAVLIVNQLLDTAPTFGVEAWYAVTAVDTLGAESNRSNIVPYSAALNPPQLVPATGITAAAFGPYPVLGSDVYLDPTSREGVIGPNGDLLAVNGLECLAQDLRIKFLTIQGELPLRPNVGFAKDKLIGSGQAKRSAQSLILRADLIDMLFSDPRVNAVLDVTIAQYNVDSWILGYVVQAIGVEDPLRLNMVWPYFLGQGA